MTISLVLPTWGTGAAEPLRLGLLPVIDILPLLAAEEGGHFRKEGLDLQLVSFASALERDVALQGGRINGYFGDLLNTLMLVNAGEKLTIVTTAFRTNPAQRMFALLASPGSGLTRPDQIKDEAVAISTATIIEFVLDEMAARLGLKDLKKTEVRQIPIRYQLLISGGLKLAVLPEPLASKAQAEGAVALADDRTLDLTLTVLALKEDLLRQEPGLKDKFRRAYQAGVEAVNAAPERFKDLLARKTQFPPSLKESYRLPPFPAPAPPPAEDVDKVQDWLLAKGIIHHKKAYSSLVAR